ncbi:MAG: hypothetical protein RB191_05435 [Terriglobia bacterium]|nr:hypothetical protein [Terriglobia bacterium]
MQHRDAILTHDSEGKPVEPEWPQADCIIGNPPFLGGKRLRTEMGNAPVDELFRLYAGRVPQEADLVTYWFEKARAQVEAGKTKRVGLLATQSIRAGANLKTLERIKESGGIFMAWSDRPWILEGAAVRVSMIGFDDGSQTERTLDGQKVEVIHANLTSEADTTTAHALPENAKITFQGPVKVGSFELTDMEARSILPLPNPHGLSNALVIRPWMNASDITTRSRSMWIIDFAEMTESEACLFEAPFELVKIRVKPSRIKNKDRQRREHWWRLGRSGSDLRAAKAGKTRLIATPRVSKHRIFVWLDRNVVPDSRLYVFARDDDYFFGVLHSRLHEAWSLATCSWHGDGDDGGRPTYNATSCFETFPFPWPPGHEPKESPLVEAIAAAARELVKMRDAWLNPPDAPPEELSKRTLTNLYNVHPTWLVELHCKLDDAVFAAYGWPTTLTDAELLERLLALNHDRATVPQKAR